MSKQMISMVAVAGLVLALAPAAQAATMQIGPGADLAGATMADTANQERLNVARTDTLTLAAGTYDVLDFQLNVLNHDTGTGDAGTITPMLLTGSPSSYTTLWVGSAFDPSSNGAQTAATYAPTTQTFTLAAPGTVFGGFFTGSNGSAIPAIAAASSGADDHDNSFAAPTGAGEAVAGPWTVNGWNRSYAFEINVDADPGDIVTPTGQVTTSNGNSAAVSTDLLQTDFGSVINSGVGGPAGGDGPDGEEPVLRDGTATDTSGYANGSLTAARVSNGDVLTYTLDTSVNTTGYQIDQVDMFHGWKDGGRDDITDIDVAYATVADPGTFLPIIEGGSSGAYGASYGRTSVVPAAPNAFLATDVAAVRITFDGIQNGYGGISEIDILGAPSGGPPPPPSITIGPGNGVGVNSGPDGGDRLNVERDPAALAAAIYSIDSFSFDSLNTSGTVIPFLATGSPGSYTTRWVGPSFSASATGIVTDTYAPGTQTFGLAAGEDVYAGFYTADGRVDFHGGGNTDHDNSFSAPTVGSVIDGFSNGNLAREYAFEVNVSAAGPPPPPFLATQTNDWGAEVPGGTYSHAVNFGSGASATAVNGVPFTAAGFGAFPSGGGNITYPQAWGGVDGNNITGDNGLADNFIHSNQSHANLNLTGLVPGQQYRLKLFSVGWDNSDRTTFLNDLDAVGEEISFAPDNPGPGQDNGTVVSYVYTAQPDGQLNLSLSFGSNRSPHIYAVTNQRIATGLPTGTFTPDTLTGDADSGIAAEKAYTHAINFNHTGNTTVNGAVFTGAGAGVASPGTNNYRTGNMTNFFTGNTNPVTGGVNGLLTEFLYDGNSPETLTLRNLRPGQKYVTTFYNTAFGSPGGRPINITTSQGDQIAFDQNFTDGRNGNLLRYEYVAHGTSLTFAFSPQINASMHQYAMTNEMVGYNALLTDNFYGPNNPDTQDINFNLADRQGGLLVARNGPISWTKTANIQVGNDTGGLDGGNYLLGAGGRGSPDWNFNGDYSQGGLSISFDAATQINTPDGTGWAAIVLGASEANQLAYVNQSDEHFGILFRGDGRLEAWDGNTLVSPTGPELMWGPGGEGNLFHHFELLMTDPTDGNPFDGVGETKIQVFADGLGVFAFTKGGGGYDENYINFHYDGVAGFDNLMVSQAVPEPATMAMLGLALAGLGGYVKRRRKRA